jgi:hypothetical protein
MRGKREEREPQRIQGGEDVEWEPQDLNDSFSSFPLPTMVCPLFYSFSRSLE